MYMCSPSRLINIKIYSLKTGINNKNNTNLYDIHIYVSYYKHEILDTI